MDEDRVRIQLKRPTTVAAEPRKDGGVSVQCLFDPSRETHFAFEIFTEFTQEMLQALGQIQQAERAREGGRLSEALRQAERILGRYPYNVSLTERAGRLRGAILEQKREMLSGMAEIGRAHV